MGRRRLDAALDGLERRNVRAELAKRNGLPRSWSLFRANRSTSRPRKK